MRGSIDIAGIATRGIDARGLGVGVRFDRGGPARRRVVH